MVPLLLADRGTRGQIDQLRMKETMGVNGMVDGRFRSLITQNANSSSAVGRSILNPDDAYIPRASRKHW